jgi:addiction module HigA family antidote
MTQKELADHLGCDIKVINRIVNGRTSVSAEMAVRLGKYCGNGPQLWLNMQNAFDLWHAQRALAAELDGIPCRAAG